MWSWRDELKQLAFRKVKTFADSARNTEWERQLRVRARVCVGVHVFLAL